MMKFCIKYYYINVSCKLRRYLHFKSSFIIRFQLNLTESLFSSVNIAAVVFQILADSPSHEVFILLPPLPKGARVGTLPPVFTVVQVCVEGGISPSEVSRTLREGRRPSGDMAAWKLAAVFDEALATKSLARVVRVAAQPNYQVGEQ